jgi:hypothetical protein
LGGRTVDEMLRAMSSAEFSDWMDVYRLDGWEEVARADQRHAEAMALTANIHRDPKKRRQPFTPADFLPPRPGAPKEDPVKRVRGKLRALFERQQLRRQAEESGRR